MSLQSLSRAWSRRLTVAALAPLLVLFSACGHEVKSHPDITVYAAASMTDALGEIASAWKAESGVGVTFSFGATSKLVPQIKEGAPADALVSADEAWMDKLVEAGKADTASRAIIARNELVFIVAAGAAKVPASAADLPGDLKLIALAGENVPAGKYAKSSLEKSNVWAAVEPRVKRAEDVRGALKWVSSAEMDGGVVYRTDALADAKVKIAFQFPSDSHAPIVYPAAVVKGAAQAAEAGRFLAFCRSAKARAIFEKFGFLPPAP